MSYETFLQDALSVPQSTNPAHVAAREVLTLRARVAELGEACALVARMDCGHHATQRNRSVESGEEFCDSCRTAEMLRDALTMEQTHKRERDEWRAKAIRDPSQLSKLLWSDLYAMTAEANSKHMDEIVQLRDALGLATKDNQWWRALSGREIKQVKEALKRPRDSGGVSPPREAASAPSAEQTRRDQCDGCAAGWSVDARGTYRMNDGDGFASNYQQCQAHSYAGIPPPPSEERFFLMSVGGNYWCPGASGYTSTVLCAGTYSFQEASARVAAGSGMVVMISMEEIIGKARLDFDPLVLMAALRRGPTP